MSDPVYDRTTIWFHWLSALLILAIWCLGQGADFAPKGPLRGYVWSTHITLGAILALLWIGRLIWRLTGGRKLPKVGEGLQLKLNAAVHGLLYLGIAVVIALGVSAAMARGTTVWGVFTYPKLIDASLKGPITEVHEWAANLLGLLAAAHAAMAVLHQYVLRDGVLARMVPLLAR